MTLPPSVHLDEPVHISELLLDRTSLFLTLVDAGGNEFQLSATLHNGLLGASRQEALKPSTDAAKHHAPGRQKRPALTAETGWMGEGERGPEKGVTPELVRALRRAIAKCRNSGHSILEILDLAIPMIPGLPKRHHSTYSALAQGFNYQSVPWDPGTAPLPLCTRVSWKGRPLTPLEVALHLEFESPKEPMYVRIESLVQKFRSSASLIRRTVDHAKSQAAAALAFLEDHPYTANVAWTRFVYLATTSGDEMAASLAAADGKIIDITPRARQRRRSFALQEGKNPVVAADVLTALQSGDTPATRIASIISANS